MVTSFFLNIFGLVESMYVEPTDTRGWLCILKKPKQSVAQKSQWTGAVWASFRYPSYSGCGQTMSAWPPPPNGPGTVPPAQLISSSILWSGKHDLEVKECPKQIKAHPGPTQLLPKKPTGENEGGSVSLALGSQYSVFPLPRALLPTPLASPCLPLPLSTTSPNPP